MQKAFKRMAVTVIKVTYLTMLGSQNALKTRKQPSFLFLIRVHEHMRMCSADANAGLTPGYFYTVAVGYYSS